MRKAAAALALVVAIISGCSHPSPQEQFVADARAMLNTKAPDAEILEVGYRTCSLIRDMGYDRVQRQVSEGDVARTAVIASAVHNLCPEVR